MKKTIYACDRCGKIIDTPDWFTVFYGVTSSESNVTKTEKLFDDICRDCMGKMKGNTQETPVKAAPERSVMPAGALRRSQTR